MSEAPLNFGSILDLALESWEKRRKERKRHVFAGLAKVVEVVNASEKNSSSGRPRNRVKSLWAASTIAGVPQAYT